MEYQIKSVCKDNNGVITGVNTLISHYTKAEVIDCIQNKDQFCVVATSGKKAYVKVYTTTHGYIIKTASDGIQDNNLDNLPVRKNCNLCK